MRTAQHWMRSHLAISVSGLAVVLVAALVAVIIVVREAEEPSAPAPRSITPEALHGTTAPRDPGHPLVFGASAGTPAQIGGYEKILGGHVQGVRIYKSWDSTIIGPDERALAAAGHTLFISVKSSTRKKKSISFESVARARPGDPVYQRMVAIAAQVKTLKGTVYLSYNHEPDNKSSRSRGTPAQYTGAWRRFVTVMGDSGVRNARYVWTLTGWSFTHDDGEVADAYYPGDAWVDYIGIDSYNWYTCHNTRWQSMKQILRGPVSFASKHPDKGLIMMEWSSAEDPAEPGRKAEWINDAAVLFGQPEYRSFVGVLQWSGRNSNDPCHFDVESSAGAAEAWRQMGRSPNFQARAVPGP